MDRLNPTSDNFILKNIITSFGQLLSYINPFSNNFFLSGLLDRLNPLSDNFILNGVITFFGQVISYINPFSENFFVYKLIDLLGDLLEYLFIPSQERLDAISNAVKSKFAFVETIKDTINNLKTMISNTNQGVELTYNVSSKYYTGSISIINLSWYAPFKPYGDVVITGFIYLFFIWRFYIHIPNIIHGLGGVSYDVYTKTEGRNKK